MDERVGVFLICQAYPEKPPSFMTIPDQSFVGPWSGQERPEKVEKPEKAEKVAKVESKERSDNKEVKEGKASSRF